MLPEPINISDETQAQLPEDLAAFIVARQMKRQIIVDALSDSIKKKRDETVKHRAASGIETEWTEDEEFYEGVDDANRGENKLVKPLHPSGVVTERKAKYHNRSTVFMNITRQYVNSAYASVSEMVNPTNNKNFGIKPTPVPELDKHKDNTTPHPAVDAQGQPVSATVADFAQQTIDEAMEKAKAAEKRIDDWLIRCNFHAEHRRVIFDAACVGTGVLKGPFPKMVKQRKTVTENGQTALEVEMENIPVSERKSCWNIYPDPTCGENIHDGSFIFELDFTNARGLNDMKLMDGYMPAQIDKVIEMGPKKTTANGNDNGVNHRAGEEGKYDVWYYYGLLSHEEVDAMAIAESLDENNPVDKKALDKLASLESTPCIVTMVNDVVIKASLNPLDSGDFPFDIFIWEKRDGSPWGRGISRIMRYAQRVVNAGIRNLMDNAGLSGGVQVGVKKGSIAPMGDGEWKLNNITFWEMKDDDARSIQDVISFHQIPSMQKELLNIIQFGQKMAEDVTGMPLLLQGQTGSAPDTVGGMQLLNKNATATRRMIARNIDDSLTEPHIRRYYDWIMMYGDESEKGDFQIDCNGSQTLVEHDIQREFTDKMLANALQPAFGIDPYKAMACALRAEMIDPTTWQYTLDEFKKMQAQQGQSPPPVVQAAQIRTASAEKIAAAQIAGDKEDATIRAQGEIQSTQMRTERDAGYEQQVAAKNAADNQYKYKQLEIQREIAMLNYANQHQMNLDAVKGQLAQTSMKLQTEQKLAAGAQAMEAATAQEERAGTHMDNAHAAVTQQAGQEHAATLQEAQHSHAKNLLTMQQKHAKELANAQHAHDLNVANLKPEVQVPGRARPGHALDQT